MISKLNIKGWSLGLLVSLALVLPLPATAADNSAQELADIEQAMMLGADVVVSGGCDKRLRAELEAALARSAPKELAHFEALEQAERMEVLDIYRDSGYLPAVVSAMGAMPGPLD